MKELVPKNINEVIKHLKPRSKTELRVIRARMRVEKKKKEKEKHQFLSTFRSKLNALFDEATKYITYDQCQEYIDDEMQQVEWKEEYEWDFDEYDDF
jgi:hypothetical protein